MSNKRIFEIVDRIHNLLAPVESCFQPFRGKQVILVEEFLELCPVPSIFDKGRPIYEWELFDKCLPQRYKLLEIMQQNLPEHEFLECLKDIRLGECTEKSRKLIESLERDLPKELDNEAVHI